MACDLGRVSWAAVLEVEYGEEVLDVVRGGQGDCLAVSVAFDRYGSADTLMGRSWTIRSIRPQVGGGVEQGMLGRCWIPGPEDLQKALGSYLSWVQPILMRRRASQRLLLLVGLCIIENGSQDR